MALSSDSAYVQVNVKYRVEGLEKATKDARSATAAVGGFGKILKQVGLSLLAFKAVDKATQGLIAMTKSLVESNAKFEKFEIQLKIFTGSAQKAADLMNFLTFQSTRLAGGLEDLLEGATALSTFGINVKEDLELVADVAQATNRLVADVAIAFGRIVAGDPRTKQFLVTRRGDMEAFNAALASGKTRLEATRIAFQRFSGVSQELEGSFSRLVENLGDVLFVGSKIAGEGLFEKLKVALEGIVDALRSEVFSEEGEVKTTGFFTSLGDSITGFIEKADDMITTLKILTHATNAFLNPVSTVTPGGQSASLNRLKELLAPDIRKMLGGDFLEGGFIGKGGLPGGFLAGTEIELRKRYKAWVFGLFGLNESGLAPIEQKEIAKSLTKHTQQLKRDVLLEETTLQMEREKKERARLQGSKDLVTQSMRDLIRRKSGRDIGKDATMQKGLIGLAELSFAETEKESNRNQRELSNLFPELDPDVQEARMNSEISLQNRFIDLKARVNAKIERIQEEAAGAAKEREQALMDFRFESAQRMTDRAVSDLGFIFFGGRGANAAIDSRISKIKEEIDVMNGVTTPLTRQEELMNRIVELDAQRVSLNERLASVVRRTLNDLIQAVAKAAVLRAFGFGTSARGQSGGFLGLLKFGLGIAQLAPGIGPVARVGLGVSQFGVGAASGGGGIGIDDGGGLQGNGVNFSPKPALGGGIQMVNPVFLSSDLSALVGNADRINERRTF